MVGGKGTAFRAEEEGSIYSIKSSGRRCGWKLDGQCVRVS